jgi:hypothetical protein
LIFFKWHGGSNLIFLKRVFFCGYIAQLYEINFKFSTFDQLSPSNTPLWAVSNLIPQKSRVVYETTYSRFEEWRSKQKVICINEKVMPSTLWGVYSMLRTMISINKNLDLSKYTNLIAFLKRQSEGYCAKKSKSFSKENIEKFLTTANDEDYLMQKVRVFFLSYKFGYYLFFVFRWF